MLEGHERPVAIGPEQAGHLDRAEEAPAQLAELAGVELDVVVRVAEILVGGARR